jgi:dTMP kinase
MLITFEGGEGAGKTTLINRLEKELSLQGFNLVKTREPGGSALSEHIRSWLLNLDFHVKVGKKAELLLFLAARAQHLEELIIPALDAGKIVFCDRFNDSTVVYQGLARGLGVKKTEDLCGLVCDGVQPDLTFFLDVDPEVGLVRTRRTRKENANDGEMDRIESEGLEFHKLVQQGFRQLAKENPQRIYRLDANKSEDAVFEEAVDVFRAKLIASRA